MARLLVADDNAESLLMERVLLAGVGHECDGATNGNEVLAAYYQALTDGRPYDLLILDAAMPEMSGFRAAEVIRVTDRETKIVIFTAYAIDAESKLRAAEAGISAIWQKPDDAARLPELAAALINGG